MRVTELVPKSEYIKWQPGDIVLIDAPTGAGKTFFVLNELVEYAASFGKDVVFLCNRISIKSQLVKTILKEEKDENKPIPENLYILSYQKCEKLNTFNKSILKIKKTSLSDEEKIFYEHRSGNTITIDPNNVMYYLFDEPQHLISGASYDTEAQFWNPENIFNNKSIFVFTTATSEPLYLYFYYHFNKKHNLKPERFFEASRKRNEIQNKISLLDSFDDIYYEEKKANLENELDKYEEKLIWQDIIVEISKIDMSYSEIQKVKMGNYNLHIYPMERDFSVYNCYYFYDYADLIYDIIKSEEKWLIFINDENEGSAFTERLNVTYQIKYDTEDKIATLLSVRTRKNKKSDAYTEYSNITETESFYGKVLVATSLIDCGVNLKDEDIKNIVISQSDKTTFLQMLGRRRIQSDEKVSLYVRAFTPSHINSLSNKNKNKIIEVANFLSLDNATYWSKISGKINFGVELQRRMLESDIANRNLADLLTVNLPKYDKFKTSNFDVKDVVNINKSKLICCFYLIYIYYGAILNNTEKHLHYYLETQLSWIDTKYEQKSWIISGELRKEIERFLDYNIGIIEQADIESFKIKLLTLLLKIPSIAFPSDIYKNLSRYKKRINGAIDISLPSQATFNEILDSFNFNCKIKNKYTYPKRKKVTNWLLEKLSEE